MLIPFGCVRARQRTQGIKADARRHGKFGQGPTKNAEFVDGIGGSAILDPMKPLPDISSPKQSAKPFLSRSELATIERITGVGRPIHWSLVKRLVEEIRYHRGFADPTEKPC